MHEVNDVADIIYSAVDPEANILFGSVIDEALGDEIMVTVIATGFNNTSSSSDKSDINIESMGFSDEETTTEETPVINIEETAYKTIEKAPETPSSPLSELINRRQSIETAVPNTPPLNRSAFESSAQPATHIQETPSQSSTTTMQSIGSKLAMDDMDDDQIPPFLKNF